ncbi:site-specific integrase [Streptomyces bauhiniae]|uniref:site-specific integrase n=1 Tax=Streptomyces bauhiniae TaxID=2340725 RepID=UPI00364991A2
MVDLGGGCGLRQGEILGVTVDAIDFDPGTHHLVQQLKLSRSKAVFAPPKGGKLRDVPLPLPVAAALRAHMNRVPAGRDHLAVESRRRASGAQAAALHRTARRSRLASLDEEAWKRALAGAGVIPVPERRRPYAKSRESGKHALRHFCASVLLDTGENIKALAEYLGHPDPGLTLRVYAHATPSSQERTRKAVAAVFETARPGSSST